MSKKLSGLSRREKPTTKRKSHISPITKKTKQELKRLGAMPEHYIDYSEIPELDFEQIGKPLIGRFYKPTKKLINI